MIFEYNYKGVYDKIDIPHAKMWDVYINEKKDYYSWVFFGSVRFLL